uniref:F-box domain-containing protein n=2 Tax=Brassica TaxID=3705 RepID=A0A0D3BS40_BRAOL
MILMAGCRSKKEQSSEPPSLIPSLPEEIIVDILARVGRCYYPKLSLVSKHFRSLVTSHELYARRSLLGCTEHSLYVVLCNRENGNHQVYDLRQKANGTHSLVLFPSLPKMPREGGFVVVGSRIYVFVADIIDGKIYVTGYCNNPTKMVMPVFDTETEMWEPKKTTPETMSNHLWPGECVVMAGKMYMRDHINSFVYIYEPKESKWETDKMLNKFKWKDACVVDDVLYYYDSVSAMLRAYDPKESSWLVVNGDHDEGMKLLDLPLQENSGILREKIVVRLVLIPWPTHVPHVGSFVTVGSKIYAFDMLNRYHHLPIPSIDCRFQTVRLVHCMNAAMNVSVAGVIDGKIYVTGYTKIPWDTSAKMVMAVFNTETQISATETMIGRPYGCVVMAGKMYTRDARNSFFYDPKESKWETGKRLNMFKWEGGWVVDDVLYYFDTRGGKVLRAYDPRKSRWVVGKDLERLVAEGRFSESYYTGSCDGKLCFGLSSLAPTVNFNEPKVRVVVRFSPILEDSLRMSSKTRSKKEQYSEPQSLIPSLPEEIIVDILARVRRCYYPKLSLVSKHFRSLVTSHELYARRSLLGCTEHSLYVVLCSRENGNYQLYALCPKANGNHSLVLFPSLSNMPSKGGFVAVGSRIYVFGRFNSVPQNAISIDCRYQTVHPLPSMNVTMSVSVADIIDGKIYVTGYCNNPTKMVMTVFNTETEMWEPKKTTPETMSGYLWARECVVMAGKMYMRDPSYSFVYDPKERKWETDKIQVEECACR